MLEQLALHIPFQHVKDAHKGKGKSSQCKLKRKLSRAALYVFKWSANIQKSSEKTYASPADEQEA